MATTRRKAAGAGRQWLGYAAAASAGLSAATASDSCAAAVVYSGPINELLRNDDQFDIDLNGDAVPDFRAFNERDTGFTYYQSNYTDYWRADIAELNGGIATTPGGIYGYVRKLPALAAIDNNQTFGDFPTLAGYRLVSTSLGIGVEGEYFGSFFGLGFAGVQFNIGGNNHFGWIQLNVNDFDRSYQIVDWAYESVPNMLIHAGDIGESGGELDGDYNDDGTVNAADYVAWRNNEGTNNTLPNDPHGGTIDQDQYNTWRDNFGQTGPAGAASAIPEPAGITLGMLALGAAGVAMLRRDRR